MPEHGFLYTDRERERLLRDLRKHAIGRPKGRALCPFCGHREARWASGPLPDRPAVVQIRVLCSQCQRRAVFEVEG